MTNILPKASQGIQISSIWAGSGSGSAGSVNSPGPRRLGGFFSCSCCLGLPFGKACLLEMLALGPEVQILRKELKVSPLYTAKISQEKKCSEDCSVQKRLFCTVFGLFGLSSVNPGPFWHPKRLPGDGFLVISEGGSVA